MPAAPVLAAPAFSGSSNSRCSLQEAIPNKPATSSKAVAGTIDRPDTV
jgi:hypothetical protein